MDDEWITPRCAAKRLGMAETNVYKRISVNRLTAVCLLGSRRMLVLREQIEGLLAVAEGLNAGEWLTVDEAAAIIGIERAGVQKRIRAGTLSPLSVHKSARHENVTTYLSRREVEEQRDSKFSRPLPDLVELSIAECAYLAGIIDGEGCIGIYHRRRSDRPSAGHQICLVVANTHQGLIEWLHDRLGGSMGTRSRDGSYPANPKWKLAHRWSTANAAACRLLDAVLPYLIVKKPQAELALLFRQHIEEELLKAPRPLAPDEVLWRQEQMVRLRELNRKGR